MASFVFVSLFWYRWYAWSWSWLPVPVGKNSAFHGFSIKCARLITKSRISNYTVTILYSTDYWLYTCKRQPGVRRWNWSPFASGYCTIVALSHQRVSSLLVRAYSSQVEYKCLTMSGICMHLHDLDGCRVGLKLQHFWATCSICSNPARFGTQRKAHA